MKKIILNICLGVLCLSLSGEDKANASYYVQTEYSWSMQSKEDNQLYDACTPLKMDMLIHFWREGYRTTMQIEFKRISYEDDKHNWIIDDFSNMTKIEDEYLAFLKRTLFGNKEPLQHMPGLAAFEEENLGYVMALQHKQKYLFTNEGQRIQINRPDQIRKITTVHKKLVNFLRQTCKKQQLPYKELNSYAQYMKLLNQLDAQINTIYSFIMKPYKDYVNISDLTQIASYYQQHKAHLAKHPLDKLKPINGYYGSSKMRKSSRFIRKSYPTYSSFLENEKIPFFALSSIYNWGSLPEEFFLFLNEEIKYQKNKVQSFVESTNNEYENHKKAVENREKRRTNEYKIIKSRRLQRKLSNMDNGIMERKKREHLKRLGFLPNNKILEENKFSVYGLQLQFMMAAKQWNWFVSAGGVKHNVNKMLELSEDGFVRQRKMEVETDFDWVNALAVVPGNNSSNRGFYRRGKIKMSAKTSLEATRINQINQDTAADNELIVAGKKKF